MKSTVLYFSGLFALAGIFAAGCATPESPAQHLPETSVPPTATEEILSGVKVAAVPVLEPTPRSDLNCIDCHSDEALLQELGEEEDVPEVPSEGSG